MLTITAEERLALQDSVKRLLAARSTEADVRRTMELAEGHDPALWKQLAELGIVGLIVDEAHGGAGAGPVELEVVLAQGSSSPVLSLGKLAMSRILHEEARVRAAILGAVSMLEGPDFPRADDANFLALNAYLTSIGGGTDQIQRNIIGERVLGLPKEPEVDRDIPFRQVRSG